MRIHSFCDRCNVRQSFSAAMATRAMERKLRFLCAFAILVVGCLPFSHAWITEKASARSALSTGSSGWVLNSKSQNAEEDVVTLLHSHHLLDHKPDTLILKGHKFKLRGKACLGRPGMALCIGPPKAHAKFKAALESAMPQKRFKSKTLEIFGPKISSIESIDGFSQSSGQGDFRQTLASIGHESEFFEVTGIQEDQNHEHRENGDTKNPSTLRKSKGKRKRK